MALGWVVMRTAGHETQRRRHALHKVWAGGLNAPGLDSGGCDDRRRPVVRLLTANQKTTAKRDLAPSSAFQGRLELEGRHHINVAIATTRL